MIRKRPNNYTRPTTGAINAVPDPTHPGGVLYTMPDGSKIEICTDAQHFKEGNLAYRTTNPGIKSDPGGTGIIGYLPKIIPEEKDGHEIRREYKYPIYATPQDAQNAVLRMLDRYDAKNGGRLTVAGVLGGRGRFNAKETYYKDYIEDIVEAAIGRPISPNMPWSSLSDEDRAQIGFGVLVHEGVFNDRWSRVLNLPSTYVPGEIHGGYDSNNPPVPFQHANEVTDPSDILGAVDPDDTEANADRQIEEDRQKLLQLLNEIECVLDNIDEDWFQANPDGVRDLLDAITADLDSLADLDGADLLDQIRNIRALADQWLNQVYSEPDIWLDPEQDIVADDGVCGGEDEQAVPWTAADDDEDDFLFPPQANDDSEDDL